MEAYKFRFSASQSGTEKVFEGGKWVRREPGYLTASMLAPLLKPLAGDLTFRVSANVWFPPSFLPQKSKTPFSLEQAALVFVFTV